MFQPEKAFQSWGPKLALIAFAALSIATLPKTALASSCAAADHVAQMVAASTPWAPPVDLCADRAVIFAIESASQRDSLAVYVAPKYLTIEQENAALADEFDARLQLIRTP